jgi:RimJ/RimL family protein N-acetyltransferase
MILATDRQDDEPVIWNWLRKRTMLPWSTDLRCIGILRPDGEIAGAVGYNGWSEQSCWMHVALDTQHSLNRTLIRAAFDYPFNQAGRVAVYGLTPKSNAEALKLNEGLGFRRIGQTCDGVIFEMRHDECRWLKGAKHGRQG